MSWRTLLLGLLLGVALGWVLCGVFGGDDPASDAPEPASSRAPGASPSLRGAAQAAEGLPSGEEPSDVPDPDVFHVLSKGGASEVRLLAADEDALLTDQAVGLVLGRLDEARASRDWHLYRALLEVLGRAGTPRADLELVEALGDETLTFPTAMGLDFHRWLVGSEVDGIADAARRRLLQNVAEGDTSWVATKGWVNLVADHGTREDLAWLLLEAEVDGIRSEGARAVAESQSERAVEWMEEVFALPGEERGRRAGGLLDAAVLSAFVGAHEERAFDVVARIVQQELAGVHVIANVQPKRLLDWYGRTVPPERADEAARLFQGLADEAQRLAAIRGVLRMRERALDVTGLESILRLPLDVLRSVPEAPLRVFEGEEHIHPDTITRAYAAMYAIEYNPALWTDEAARILEETGAWFRGRHSLSSDLFEAARKIRAALRSPWRTR